MKYLHPRREKNQKLISVRIGCGSRNKAREIQLISVSNKLENGKLEKKKENQETFFAFRIFSLLKFNSCELFSFTLVFLISSFFGLKIIHFTLHFHNDIIICSNLQSTAVFSTS